MSKSHKGTSLLRLSAVEELSSDESLAEDQVGQCEAGGPQQMTINETH